ncbi:zinc-finger associated domain (zf-AD) domain-containing protein [Phthorimaea operculella]|nr:zinc-finger associated domain (zf-AD) domain-containing protein [Phthorimaea operculella]
MSVSGGICISCLETDNVFNIFDTHECEGIEEIYVEMLKSCFDIGLSKNQAVNFMCEKCILVLRQAYYFKQNVLKNLKELESKGTLVEERLDHDILADNINAEQDSATGQNIYSLEDDTAEYIMIYQESNEEDQSDKDVKLMQSIKKEKRNSEKDDLKYEAELIQSAYGTDQPTQYECAHCQKRFLSKVAIARHMKTHEDGPFPCHICNQVFSKFNTRNSHMWRDHQRHPYACQHCDQRFPTFHKRLAHLKDEHGQQKEYPCPYCDNTYSYAGARSQHIRATHLRVHNHPCTECKMGFFKRRALLNHLASIHGIGEKKFVCPVCSKSFYRKPILNNHIKLHLNKVKDKKFKCSVCPAEFSHRTLCKTHMELAHNMDTASAVQNLNNTDIVVANVKGNCTEV